MYHCHGLPGPALPNGKTDAVYAEPFEKAGLIARVVEGLEIHSDLGEQGFILLDEDIGVVLDGDKRDIRRFDARDLAGPARLSASGRAWNIAISPYYYTIHFDQFGGPGSQKLEKGGVNGEITIAGSLHYARQMQIHL